MIQCSNVRIPSYKTYEMHVGVCRITLRLPENHSLKGKRGVIGSLCARIRNKFNVSVAEVDDNDAWQLATLGLTSVSNDARQSDKMLSAVLNFVETGRDGIEIVECEQEVLSGF